MENLGNFPIFASFTAGLLSFISPCILPLIPAFISFITGISLENLQKKEQPLKIVFLKTLVFVAGFSLVFIVLGLSASWLGGVLGEYKSVLRYAGGAVVIIFGLHICGIYKIKFLYRQVSSSGLVSSGAGWAGSFFVGAAFAMGWTPCVGPILASILLVASTQGSVLSGFWLLVFFSLGLGIPFILTSLFISRFLKFSGFLKKYYKLIEIFSGILLILVGILLITDGFSKVTVFLLRLLSK